MAPTRFQDRWLLTADDLERLCAEERDVYRPRLVVLNYPANPSGTSYGPAELEAIADVAQRYRLVLLSDEIYGELHTEGGHVSITHYYPEGTIISSGLSKWCGAGGWRLGTFTFPAPLDWLRDALASVASETYTAVCAPVQYAAVTAFQGGVAIERYLWHARRILKRLGCRLAYVNFDGARALAASERVPLSEPLPEGFEARYCPQTIEAVDRLAEWLAG